MESKFHLRQCWYRHFDSLPKKYSWCINFEMSLHHAWASSGIVGLSSYSITVKCTVKFVIVTAHNIFITAHFGQWHPLILDTGVCQGQVVSLLVWYLGMALGTPVCIWSKSIGQTLAVVVCFVCFFYVQLSGIGDFLLPSLSLFFSFEAWSNIRLFISYLVWSLFMLFKTLLLSCQKSGIFSTGVCLAFSLHFGCEWNRIIALNAYAHT